MKRLYIVWDVVAKAVASAVLVYVGDAAAIRGFTDALSDPQGPYAKHAGDFDLWFIGDLVEDQEAEQPSVVAGGTGAVFKGSQFVALQQPSLVPSSQEA